MTTAVQPGGGGVGQPAILGAGRRYRHDPGQGPGHRCLRAGVAGRHRVAHHRRARRDRERRHVPPLRPGGQPPGHQRREGGPAGTGRRPDRGRGPAKTKGALEGAGQKLRGVVEDVGERSRQARAGAAGGRTEMTSAPPDTQPTADSGQQTGLLRVRDSAGRRGTDRRGPRCRGPRGQAGTQRGTRRLGQRGGPRRATRHPAGFPGAREAAGLDDHRRPGAPAALRCGPDGRGRGR